MVEVMKNIILDIDKLSDIKEVYDTRPNLFYIYFIYGVMFIFLVALTFCYFGKIDMVATASGAIRPNNHVSTVTNVVAGKITDVYYADGGWVEKGDPLYSVDSTEAEANLEELMKRRAQSAAWLEMHRRFIDAIESRKNPFSDDKESDEYEFYIKFENFLITYNDTKSNAAYEADKVRANINAETQEIAVLTEDTNGLKLLRGSIEQGRDLTGEMSVYKNKYLSYQTGLAVLENEYRGQRVKMERDTSADSNAAAASYYQKQIDGYRTLIQSIKNGRSGFSGVDAYSRLYDDYVNNLAESRRAYDAAQEKYDYYNRGGAGSGYVNDMLAYNKTMLEGYNY